MEHHHQIYQNNNINNNNNNTYIEEIDNLHNIISLLSERIQQLEATAAAHENSNFTETRPVTPTTMEHEPIRIGGGYQQQQHHHQLQQHQQQRDPSAVIFPCPDENAPDAAEEQQERIIRVLADTAPFMMWMSDARGNFVYLNSKYFEFTGVSLEDSNNEVGDGWSNTIHPDDKELLFLVDPDDANLLHIVQKYNVIIETNNTSIRLPVGYWQECINLCGGHSSGGATTDTYEDVHSADQHSFEDPPSSPFGEDDTTARMMELIHQSSMRLVCRPSIYSSFYQHYLTPIFQRLGMLSMTAEYIRGTTDHPFGFVCVAAKTEKDYNSGEQNTLRVMANILSAYIRQEEDTKSLESQQNLTSTLSRSSREGIIKVNATGLITEMNPSALELFSMNSRQVKQKYPISVLFPFITDTMREGDTFEHYMSEHIVKYRQNITFKESSATLLNGHQSFHVDLMIKEIFIQDTKVFIFLIRNKSNRPEIPAPVKNSIDSIVNMSKALVDSDVKSKGVAESILRVSSNLQTLVDGLIDLPNLKLPTLKLKYDLMKVTDCVEQSLLLTSPIAQKHGIEILPIYDNQLPTFINGDMSLLRQILINLLENSINSTKDIKALVLQVNLLQNNNQNRQTTSTTTTTTTSTSNNNNNNNNNSNNNVFTTIQFEIKLSLSSERVQKVEQPFVEIDSGIQQCQDIIQMMGGSIQIGQSGSTYKFTISSSYVSNLPPNYNYNRRILTISPNYYRRQMLSKVWHRFQCHGDFVPKFLLKEDILNIVESNYEFVFIDFSYDQAINEFIGNLSSLRSEMKSKKIIVVIIDSTFPYIHRITPFIDHILIKPTSLDTIESLIKI
ncbi:hypothetical protein PPL_10452 [Heterostelium album PN500]|uniref:PAS domain-containing protein n=1 Tax=Heterostelium pallidum (strain ATCC 26659 / Pp 5 / PN500) TaxID=670386 RepID=D3BR48_HETP5|nr:hypothetical protein PPL_10452 [Heterostelium album PN500]EFA75880.1 hypothetical protein PPL_10452 [Heterostelium album PN500]|eukprot:XP_020428014.1 hypothetical protein PPL_10452 [Heterostelium album PN500]